MFLYFLYISILKIENKYKDKQDKQDHCCSREDQRIKITGVFLLTVSTGWRGQRSLYLYWEGRTKRQNISPISLGGCYAAHPHLLKLNPTYDTCWHPMTICKCKWLTQWHYDRRTDLQSDQVLQVHELLYATKNKWYRPCHNCIFDWFYL